MKFIAFSAREDCGVRFEDGRECSMSRGQTVSSTAIHRGGIYVPYLDIGGGDRIMDRNFPIMSLCTIDKQGNVR